MSFKILFLGKKNDELTNLCSKLCKEKYSQTTIYFSSPEDIIPENILNWEGDIIISYLFPKLIPNKLLLKAKMISVNFHPGPPERRGIGCTNYAIYEKSKNYGVTLHEINEKIDSGNILKVKRFKINSNETVYSLTKRSYLYILELFIIFLKDLDVNNVLFTSSNEKWKGPIKTRKDFMKFLKLSKNMTKNEIKNRIYATTYPGKEAAKF